jgi:hypothetical protein
MLHDKRTWLATLVAIAIFAGPGCDDDGASSPDAGSDGGVDAPQSEGGIDSAGTASLAGVIKDSAGVVVVNAQVVVGDKVGFSDQQGKYTVAGLAPGAAAIKVTRNWFKPLETNATIGVTGITSLDLVLEEIPLKVEPADQALADTYNKTFDWTKQTLSVAVMPRPTRRDFDNAVYFKNPALYRDTSMQTPVTPMPQIEITAGVAKNISFPLRSGSKMGQEAFDLTTIADAIKDTPLGPSEPAEFMMWTPVVNWLSEGDAAKSADLKAVTNAVRLQAWGTNAIRAQDLEKVYLDATGALWAKIVFAPYLQVGAGINDDDGDGQKEIYAKVTPALFPAEFAERLKTDYNVKTFTTHGLSKEVAKSLSELYSTTAAVVERFIGQPFEAAGVGTFQYPFVVLSHANGRQRNVILVGPAP